MANRKHLAKLKEGVKAWNEWRRLANDVVVDLRGADLVGGNLEEVDLSQANVAEADFRKANLRRAKLLGTRLFSANFARADLSAADLRKANLLNVNFHGANLDDTDLSESDLDGAYFAAASLKGTNFKGAMIGDTTFAFVDLSEAKGLDAMRYGGPSTIGVDSIYLSQGKIPLAFLRGAGMPEKLIEYVPSLVAPEAIQFYSCFISYSTADQSFASRLYADLQESGVRCWFAPQDAQGGRKLYEQIDDAIRRYERLLLILSADSMNSRWVETEIRKARGRERTEGKRILFPVGLISFDAIRQWELFDADEGKDLAVEIREYYIPDFSDWKNRDSYGREFGRLLRDLRTSESQGGGRHGGAPELSLEDFLDGFDTLQH